MHFLWFASIFSVEFYWILGKDPVKLQELYDINCDFYDTKGHFKFLYVALYYRCTKCNFRCIALYSLDYVGHRQRSYQITGAM